MSFKEYLIKQYLQTARTEPVYLSMWNQALAGIEEHLITTTRHSNLRFVAELPWGIGGGLSPKMDHLVCFLPGTIALGATEGLTLAEARKKPGWNKVKEAQINLAKDLAETCWGMYAVTETGIAPEIVWFEADATALQPRPKWRARPRPKNSVTQWKKDYTIKPLDAHNLQRPETLESLFYMWRITQDEKYREQGWEIFQAFQKYGFLLSGGGYTSLNDVNQIPPPKRDNMESFWLVSCTSIVDHVQNTDIFGLGRNT
jgi:mannosyl-oligosaccharide alpha-1,2-mannosidase